MKPCITANSLKLFGKYFTESLPSILNESTTYNQVMQKLYEQSIKDFSGRDVTEQGVSTEEVVLQHMTIVPALIQKSDIDISPELGIEFDTNARFFNAQIKKGLSDFTNAVNDLANIVNPVESVSAIPAPVDPSAIRVVYPTTHPREVVYDETRGYVKEELVPELIGTNNTARKIIADGNVRNFSLSLKLVNGNAVLEVIDSAGNPVYFDQQGNVSSADKGTIVQFNVVTDKKALKNTLSALIANETARTGNNEQAKKNAILAQNNYVRMMDEALAKVRKGETVTFNIDLAQSSLGFVETNFSVRTPINEIKNASELEFSTSMGNLFAKVPKSAELTTVYPRTLDSFSETEINNIIELITNNNLKDSNGQFISKTERFNLLRNYLRIGKADGFTISFAPDNAKNANQVQQVVINNTTFTVSNRNVSAEKRAENKAKIEQAFMNFIKGYSITPLANSNIRIPRGNVTDSYENVSSGKTEVVHQQQFFKDSEGTMYIAKKPEVSFYSIRNGNLSDLKVVSSIQNDVVATKIVTPQQWFSEVGVITAVPNKNGEVRGYSPYIAFSDVKYKTNDTAADEIVPFFMEAKQKSFSEEVKGFEVSSQEELAAETWFKSSEWSKVLRLYVSANENSRGPEYIASFIGNVISLYKGSDRTAIYHEVFHAFARGILTAEERKALYNEVLKDLKGQTADIIVKGVKKNVAFSSLDMNSDADMLTLEEWMAEEFRAYAREKSIYNSKPKSKLAQFFDRVVEMIKSLLGNFTYAEIKTMNALSPVMRTMFNDVYTGNLDFSRFDPVATNEEFNMSVEIEGAGLSYQEIRTTMTYLQTGLYNFLDLVVSPTSNYAINKALSEKLVLMSELPVNTPEWNKAKEDYDALRSTIESGDSNARGIWMLEENPELLQDAFEYLYNKLEVRRDMLMASKSEVDKETVASLNKVLDNFGDLTRDAKSYIDDSKTVLGVFLNKYSTINLQDVFTEDTTNDSVENLKLLFDRTGAEVSLLDSVDERTKELLSTLPYYSENGRGAVSLNSFGGFKAMPLNKVVFKVATALSKSYTMKEMYDALEAASKDEQGRVTDKTLALLVRRLGNPSKPGIHPAEIRQWRNFWKSFAKASVKLRTFEIEKVVTPTQETADLEAEFREYDVSLISKNSKGQYKTSIARREWSFNFVYLMTLPATKDTPSLIAEKNKFSTERFLNYMNELVEYDPLTGSVYPTKQAAFNTQTKRRFQAEPAAVFKALGIDIPNTPEVNSLLINGSESYDLTYKFLEYFSNSIENRATALFDNQRSPESLDNLFKGFKYRNAQNQVEEQPDLTGYLNKLAAVAIELGDTYSTFMQKTPEGENQSEKPLHSSLTTEVTIINAAQSIDELVSVDGMEQFDFELNPEVAGSNTFIQMFRLDLPMDNPNFGKRNPKISITIENLVGSKVRSGSIEKGVKSMGSDEFSKFVTDFHVTLEGTQEVMRTEAKSTSVVAIMPTLNELGVLQSVAFSNEIIDFILQDGYATNMTNNGFVLYDKFISHIEAELVRINRIQELMNKIESGEVDSVQFDQAFLKRGSNFIKFMNILSPNTQNTLLNTLTADGNKITQVFTLRETLNQNAEFKKQIELEFLNYFKLRVGEMQTKFGERLIIGDNILAKYSLAADQTEQATRDRLFYMFGINNFFNNMEFQAMFLGDISNYKFADEDFHKRIAGKISAGDVIVNEKAWYDYVNSDAYNKDGFAKKAYAELTQEQKEAAGLPLEFTSRAYKGYLNTGVMAEAESNSVYAKAYQELFGIDEESYQNMEEADGAAYVQFDTYRLILDSIGEWSAGQEEVYQKMLRGEKINQLEITNTFPIKKWQYYGPLFNESFSEIGLMPFAFHKYSVIPLIPGTLKNTPLEDLHNRMLTEGIDYMAFKSASKLSTVSNITLENLETGKASFDNIYDVKNGRQITNNSVTPNVIHVKHLKSQVYMAEGYKGKINLFSQMRKIATLGTFNGGVPVGYKGTKESWDKLSEKKKLENKYYAWFKNYNQVLDNIRTHARANLLENLGLKEVVDKKTKTVSYEGNTKKLVQYIQQEIANKNILPEEVAHIIKPGTDGEMVDDLTFSLNAAKIEEILMTLVDNELRNLSFNGEGLVQMPGTMTELKLDLEVQAKSEEDQFATGTNGLSFYHVVDENGNPAKNEKGFFRVKEAQVKIALQGDFKNLLYLTYKGETIAKYDEVVDELTGKNKRTLDFDASLEALNAALKDKAFVEEHIDKLRLVGPRIPTQAENSIESMVVAEFLPPIMGNRIILPSEIVAKAGSDYDIDKLFMMFPSIRRYGNAVELVKYLPQVTESDTELHNQINAYDKEIEQLRNVIGQAYTNKSDLYNNIKDVKGAFKEQHADLFEEKEAIEAEIARSLSEASDVYNNTGDFQNYTRTQQIAYHKASSEKRDGLYSLLSVVDGYIKNAYNEFLEENNIPAELIDRKSFEANDKVIEQSQARIAELQESKYDVIRKLDGKLSYGLQNQLLDLFAERVSFAENAKGLLEPNSTNLFDKLAADLEKQFRKESVYDKFNGGNNASRNNVAGTTLFDYMYNLQKHQDNSGGMNALGVAAVTSTFYAVFTQMGAKLNGVNEVSQKQFNDALKIISDYNVVGQNTPAQTANYYEAKLLIDKYKDYTIKMPHQNENGIVSLSNLNNVDGVSISNIIGQLINGFVDVAKKAWIFNIEGTMQNTPQLLLMVMAGVGVEEAVYMSTHPIVREYNKLRAEFEGVFATLDKEVESSLFVQSARQATERAQQAIKEKYSIVDTFESLNKLITEPFTKEELKEAVFSGKKDFSKRDFEVLAHYISLQRMSDDVTDFTMVTKFDTQKLQNLSEAESRITQTEEIMSKDKSFDNEWFELIQNTPIGKFNNDEFFLELFSKYFGVRNNGIVIKKSTGIRAPKGVDRAYHLKNYKDDFLWFMYQNAVYQNDRYKEFNIVYDNTYDKGVVIDGTTVHVNKDIAENERILKAVNIGPFFPQLGHYVRFEVERQRLVASHGKDAITNSKKFQNDFFHFQNVGYDFSVTGMINKMALFYSANNVAMFDFSFGYATILKNLQLKYADELINNELFNDLKYDKDQTQANFYLESLSNDDPSTVSLYRENLTALKNSKIKEVAEFFNQFEHYAIMQSGLNKGKYNLTRIIDESLFINVIDEAYDISAFTRTLDRSTKLLKQGTKIKEINTELLDTFHEMFQGISSDIVAYRKRTKGQNYINDNVKLEAGTTALDRALSYEKVGVYATFKAVPEGQIKLTVDDLYDVNNKLNEDFINSLEGKTLAILKHKFVAPEGASQKKLDEVLNRLGIDNSKDVPQAIIISKGQTANNLSIADSDVLKTYALKDEIMANSATKAIGQVTLGYAPAYRSSTEAYVQVIEQKYSQRLAGTKGMTFKPTDSVWVFGSGIFQNAYTGVMTKEQWEASVQKTFDTYHRKHIDRAIQAGVKTFNVGNASGIDQLAKAYLESKGFSGMVRYTNAGKYFEMVTADYQAKVTDLHELGVKPNSAKDLLQVDLYDKELDSKLNALTKEELQQGIGYAMVKSSVIDKLQTKARQSADGRSKLHRSLIISIGTPLSVGNSLQASFIEQYLMEVRIDIKAKHDSAANSRIRREAERKGQVLSEKSTPANKIINDADVNAFNAYLKKSGKKPNEFFTQTSTFSEFYDNTTGKRSKAPQSSIWQLNIQGNYDLIDKDGGEIYIENVDLTTGKQIPKTLSQKTIPVLQQNFADGSEFKENNKLVPRTMRAEFKGKSSMELVLEGSRTRLSHSKTAMKELMTQLNVSKVSDIIGKELYMMDQSGKTAGRALAIITNVSLLTQEYQDATWEKEGWTKDVTDRLIGKDYYGIEFTVTSVENFTAEDIKNSKNKKC